MPTRSVPTERQRRLGAELRKLRLAAGVTTDYAAGLLGLDRTKISNMESGVRAITAERVRTLTSNYACMEPVYVDALVDMADSKESGWWEEYRGTLPSGLLDIAEVEWHAARVQTWQAVHLPGLLQSEDYARAVFGAGLPPMSRLEVELRVNNRLERQRVLERDKPLPYVGYIHEAALRMQFGGRQVTRAQLEYLCEVSTRENITLRVLTVECGAFPGAGHALLYAEGVVPQLDTVQLDSAHGPVFTHAEAQLAKYRMHLAWMSEVALPPEESREFIHSIAREL
ncbi:helix-turn-helix domain-containing protein [Kitasatospora sp. LaBMicrA B282]|uniref:helix-turn-helix domain-containing protein n=1 Tax=Kitasatospora sp. LaBMicrA B282 TaxID=3420949 RepID=UPI003D0A6017